MMDIHAVQIAMLAMSSRHGHGNHTPSTNYSTSTSGSASTNRPSTHGPEMIIALAADRLGVMDLLVYKQPLVASMKEYQVGVGPSPGPSPGPSLGLNLGLSLRAYFSMLSMVCGHEWAIANPGYILLFNPLGLF